MQPQTHGLIRYLGDVFLAFVVIMFVAGLGSILGFTLSATGLLPLFLGPTFVFFILAGSGVGYLVNRRRCSRAAPWMWVLPAIWSAYEGARDLNSGIHNGDWKNRRAFSAKGHGAVVRPLALDSLGDDNYRT